LKKVILVISFIVSGLSPLFAQDIQFSQFYAVPTYQNPAFAGSAHAPRGVLHNRLQWVGLGANYKTVFASGDTYLSNYRSGIGVIALRDWQGNGILNSTEVGLQYSYEIPVSDAVTVRAGLQGSLVSRSLNYASLRFPSEFTDTTGYTASGRYPTGSQNILYPDISAGTVVYSDKAWFGFAAHHLNQPSQSFVSDPNGSHLPMKLDFIGGYKINIQQSGYLAYTQDEKEISITPTFYYKHQGPADQLDLGIYGIYDQLLLGAWYRGLPIKKYNASLSNNEALIVFLGWRVENWSFGYSYDMTISRLAQAKTKGAHEFNITYVHHVKKKRRVMKRLPCPSFYKH